MMVWLLIFQRVPYAFTTWGSCPLLGLNRRAWPRRGLSKMLNECGMNVQDAQERSARQELRAALARREP